MWATACSCTQPVAGHFVLMTRARKPSCPMQSSLSRHRCRHHCRHRCRQRCRHRCRDNHLRRLLTRGAALQYELGLVLQHQYSLVPIVPLNCVRPSAVRGVRVYQTSYMRGIFHRTRRGRNRHVDASTLPQMARLPGRGPSPQSTSRLRVAVN
jgi:hypothetical protein